MNGFNKVILAGNLTRDPELRFTNDGVPVCGFGLAVTLRATIIGVDQATAQKIVDFGHQVCPYSNATRGNIPVTVDVTIA